MAKEKIRSLIINIVALLILNISLFFTDAINGWIYSTLDEKFSIVSSVGNLEVHYISVGNGDAIAINLPDQRTMLIDTGTINQSRHYTSYIKQKVLPLDKDKRIDWLVLTHADADHIGGTEKLLNEVDVDLAYVPILPSASNSDTYKRTMAAIEEKTNSEVTSKDILIKGENYSIEFLGPVSLKDTNNSCSLIKLDYMDKTFLFTGDIGEEAEREYASQYGSGLKCDVLKVSHHGSKTASSTRFLELAMPSISVISVGENNQYGHPNSETLARLESTKSKIYRTDLDGDIMVVLGDRYDLKVQTDNYTIFNLRFDFRIILFIVDGVVAVKIIFILFKKKSKKIEKN